jgi:phosphoribosyl 1,2-cyclic phosphodiesterase
MVQLIRNGSGKRQASAQKRGIARWRTACAAMAAEETIMMRIRFWGVRGSIATAGPHTATVGGNTSCVEIASDAGAPLIVLDAGTGLRALGEHLVRRKQPVEVELLLSHLHWDHIQGFPFFAPAYVPGNRIALRAPERCAAPTGSSAIVEHFVAQAPCTARTTEADVRAALAAQMRAPHFPVSLEAMRAQLSFYAVAAGAEFELGRAQVRAAAARHPNGCLAYRVTIAGRSVVYATDTEHDGDGAVDPDLSQLCDGADVLIYDAQYTEAEYATKRGWGHSTAEAGARLAAAARVRQLVLFHHDPAHDDATVAAIERATRARFPATVAAREGLELVLAPPTRRVA